MLTVRKCTNNHHHKPKMAIQGNLFSGQWKANKGLNNILYDNAGLISKASQDRETKSIKKSLLTTWCRLMPLPREPLQMYT